MERRNTIRNRLKPSKDIEAFFENFPSKLQSLSKEYICLTLENTADFFYIVCNVCSILIFV